MANPPNRSPRQEGNVLIIHDQIRVRNLLRRIISLEGYTVYEALNMGQAAILAASEDIEVIVSDSQLAGRDGLLSDKESGYDFSAMEIILLPPADNPEYNPATLLSLLSRALEKVRLRKKIAQLESSVDQPPDFDQIIGESSIIREAISLARKMAPTDATVWLQGETGTGKELFARAIHAASPRSLNPFITLHCSAFSKEELEWELFGCKAGTHPGITRDKKGLLEEAGKGSLLIDGIGELDIDLQTRLLRALENNEFTRPGDNRPIRINVRIFSTTQKDLAGSLLEGSFREDLFYRLNVFTISLPSLRERKMDIPLLARRFLRHFARKADLKIEGMSKDFLYHLQRYAWRGNIRELRNVIERAVIMTDSPILSEESLPRDIRTQPTDSTEILASFDLKNVERLHLQRVLNYCGGNKAEAAKLLNIGLTTLYRKINEYEALTDLHN